MKALKLLAFSLIVFSFSSCDDEVFDIHFGLNTKDVTFTVQPTAAAGDIALDTTVQNVNFDSLISANGADPSHLKSAKAKKITAKIEMPAGGNFDVLQSGYITIGAPGLPTIHIAEFTSVPLGSNQFDITPMDVDLLPYARAHVLETSGRLTTNGAVTEPTTIKLTIDFEVIANPL